MKPSRAPSRKRDYGVNQEDREDLWLLPLGLLVYRSGFLPCFLGAWLTINGLAYVVISLTGLLLPQYVHTVFLIAQPALMGEVALTLWLLIVGARVQPAREPLAV